MGTTEEFLRLLVEIKGDQAIKDLKKQLADLDVESAKLKAQFDAQTISEAQLEAETRKLAATSAQLKATLGESTNKMAGFGQSALQTGRVVQDFAQGGLGGILNNIEGLTQAMGGGAGLAGTLTLVGVGFMLLKPHIEEIVKQLGLFKQQTDLSKTATVQLTEKIKELTEKPITLAFDLNTLTQARKELDQLKKEKAAFDEFMGLKSSAQKEAGGRVTEAIGETGEAGKITAEIQAQMAAEIRANDPIMKKIAADSEALKKQRAELEADTSAPFRKTQLEEIRVKLAENLAKTQARDAQILEPTEGLAHDAAAKLLERAKSGEDDEAVGMLADRLAAGGRGGLGEKIRGISPKAIIAERLTETGKENAEIARKEREKIAEDNRKAAEEATEFEVKHEDHMALERKKHVDAAGKAVEAYSDKEKERALEFDEKQAKRREKAVDVFTKEAEKGTIDEFATAKAAELRAQGGYMSSRGRFIPLDEGGQRAALQGELEKRIGGEYGGASKGVAANLTRGAFGDVERQTSDLTAAGFSQAAANQQVMAASIEALRQQVAKLAGVGREIDRGRDKSLSRLGMTR
jgi:hypothetical protein